MERLFVNNACLLPTQDQYLLMYTPQLDDDVVQKNSFTFNALLAKTLCEI